MRKTFFRHAAFAFRCDVDLSALDTVEEWDEKTEPTFLRVLARLEAASFRITVTDVRKDALGTKIPFLEQVRKRGKE